MATNINELKIATHPRKEVVLLPADVTNLAAIHEAYATLIGQKVSDSAILRRALALLVPHLKDLRSTVRRSAEAVAILTSGLPR